jgi:hypothetical protein
MMIASWRIGARFGHKQTVIDSLKKWNAEIGTQIGWTADKVRLLTGAVGEAESAVIAEIQIEDLAELNASWEKLGTIQAHKEWSKELEPYVVSGSHRWQVYRVV